MNKVVLSLNSKNGHESFLYPGGEYQVRLKPNWVEPVNKADKVVVFAQVENPSNLVELLLLLEAIRGENYHANITLVLPYLPYARSDRRFVPGDCFGSGFLLGALSKFGLSCGLSNFRIITLDRHSEVTNYAHSVSALPYIQQAAWDLARKYAVRKLNILFPDKGAKLRYDLTDEFLGNTEGLKLNKLHAEKQRDPVTGKLSGFKVPKIGEIWLDCPTLIVDDICDGGGTFIGIAKALCAETRAYALGNISLYTTHGIYSKGMLELAIWFNHVYTTDSFTQNDESYQKPIVFHVHNDLIAEALK